MFKIFRFNPMLDVKAKSRAQSSIQFFYDMGYDFGWANGWRMGCGTLLIASAFNVLDDLWLFSVRVALGLLLFLVTYMRSRSMKKEIQNIFDTHTEED